MDADTYLVPGAIAKFLDLKSSAVSMRIKRLEPRSKIVECEFGCSHLVYRVGDFCA